MIIDQVLIDLDLSAHEKDDAILELVSLAHADSRLKNKERFLQDVLLRESEVSTALGNGIAIPHGKSEGVLEPFIAFGRAKHPIKWADQEVSVIFLIGVPEKNYNNLHLKLIADISRKLIEEDYRQELREALTKQEIMDLLVNP